MPEEFIVSSHNTNLYCRKYGDGDPVLMIHGAFVDCDYYMESAALLGRTFAVYTYDRCGCGRSDDREDHSVETQAEDAAEVIRAIGGPCHIIAHSGGSDIAMELAARYPELVKKMLLHEPLGNAPLLRGDDCDPLLLEIDNLIRQNKFHKAIVRSFPLFGEKDSRARKATDDEMLHLSRNAFCFIQKEFRPLFSYNADADALRGADITIGIGDASRGTNRCDAAIKLADRLGAGIVWFPGGHNGPFDLPREFAWIATGLLSSSNQIKVD